MEITERKRLRRKSCKSAKWNSAASDRICTTGSASTWPGIELKSQALAENLQKKAKAPGRSSGANRRPRARGHRANALAGARTFARYSRIRRIDVGAEGIGRHGKLFDVQVPFSTNRVRLPVPDQAVATHLYRIAQEAVPMPSNTAKPASIEIRLSTETGADRPCVKDNGIGLAPGRSAGNGRVCAPCSIVRA